LERIILLTTVQIEVLSRDPSILKRQAAWSVANRSDLVKDIIKKALGHDMYWKPKKVDSKADPQSSTDASGNTDTAKESVTEDAQSDGEGGILVAKADSFSGSASTGLFDVNAQWGGLINTTSEPKVSSTQEVSTEEPSSKLPPISAERKEFNFDTLIPPEVWEELLPVCRPLFSSF
jgi:hypothetical protein